MLCFPLRGALALAAAGLATPVLGFTNIDDFTVGGFSKDLVEGEQFSKSEFGLDRNHSALGNRATTISAVGFWAGETLRVRVGSGEQRFSSSLPVMWSHTMTLGRDIESIDLSRETDIYFDLQTDPPNALADNWDVLVRDLDGMSASNGGWLLRQGGIRFRIAAFSRRVDWSRISTIQVTQDWDSLPNPTMYNVSRIYAVPEPGTLLAAIVGVGALRRRRAPKMRG